MVAPLAVELAPLRVNAVSPGVIDTHWWNGIYLAGAGFVTGTVLECTGGSNLTAAALAS